MLIDPGYLTFLFSDYECDLDIEGDEEDDCEDDGFLVYYGKQPPDIFEKTLHKLVNDTKTALRLR